MDETEGNFWTQAPAAMLRGLRPAWPAAVGAAALTFLFAAVMPLAWVSGISWNLYLDRLSDLFLPPVGNGGRLALALAMALIAALLAGLIALALAKPEVRGNDWLNRRVAKRAREQAEAEGDSDDALHRRRADRHPDDPPRPPIRAVRDLPAEGLRPVAFPTEGLLAEEELELSLTEVADADDELMLADLAPVEPEAVDAPWLQPAEIPVPAADLEPADQSLGAMVARLEAGLARRQSGRTALAAEDAANEDGDANVDFALEAALSTLQRMTRRAVG